jgi:L-iditol 2-dehydrogenase
LKVAVWYNNKDIRIEDVHTPQPGPTEILVKVIACGICGSDIVEWYRLPRAPLVQGHEIGAEVVAVGQSVKKFKRGDRVFIAPKVPCLQCNYCRNGHFAVCSNVSARLPGGFAEFVLVPESIVENGTYLLPDTMTYDESTLIEPLACVVRAQKLAGVRANQTVMVMGCGMSGLLQVKLAKANQCMVIATDLHHRRLEIAAGFGADVVIHAAEDLPERLVAAIGKEADVVILCTAAISAVEQAWTCVDKGGTIVFFAVPGPEKEVTVPINYFWTRETKILTSYYCGPGDILDAIHLIAKRTIRVDDMITHRLPLNDIARGFQLVIDGDDSLKVIIKPHQS